MRPFDILFAGCPWVRVQAHTHDEAIEKALAVLAIQHSMPVEPSPRRVDDLEAQRAIRAW
jgi:hypothetical protein